jgi:DNA-binding winged helix-turn-helix (wHTH) protein
LLYSFEDFSLDTARRELRRGGALIALQPQVFDLIEYLIRNRERVVSKHDLISTIWQGRAVSDVALSTRLNAVRRRSATAGTSASIRTAYGKGILCRGGAGGRNGRQARSGLCGRYRYTAG